MSCTAGRARPASVSPDHRLFLFLSFCESGETAQLTSVFSVRLAVFLDSLSTFSIKVIIIIIIMMRITRLTPTGMQALCSWSLSRIVSVCYTSDHRGHGKEAGQGSFAAPRQGGKTEAHVVSKPEAEVDDYSDYKINYDSNAEDDADIYKKMKATYTEIQSAVDAKNGFVGDLSTLTMNATAAAAKLKSNNVGGMGSSGPSFRSNANANAYSIGSTYSPYTMLKKVEMEQRKQPDRPFSVKKKNSYLDIFRELDYRLHFSHKARHTCFLSRHGPFAHVLLLSCRIRFYSLSSSHLPAKFCQRL